MYRKRSASGERRAASILTRARDPSRELLELATGEGSKALSIGYSIIATDVVDYFINASTIQFFSTNLTNRFEQMGVSVCERSDGSRHRCTIPLKMPLDGRCLGAKSSAVKRVLKWSREST